MSRIALFLLNALVVVGCTGRRVADHEITLRSTNGQLFEKLTADGVVTDSKAQVVARYESAAKTITFSEGALAGTVVHAENSISVRGPRIVDVKVGPFVKYRYRVTESNELLSIAIADDGSGPAEPGATEATVGHLEGYEASTAGAAWLGVMMCGLAVVAAPHPSLVLFDGKGRLVEQMSPDGVIRDHLGAVLARYVAGTLKDPASDQTLDIRVLVQDPRDLAVWPAALDFGYRIRVTSTNEVRAQRLHRGSYPDITPIAGAPDEQSGHLEGYVPSQDNANRLGAMLCVLSSVEPHDPDARLPLERQPPPPPPPAPMSTRHQ